MIAPQPPPVPFDRDQMVEMIFADYEGSSTYACSLYPAAVDAYGYDTVDLYVTSLFEHAYNFELTDGAKYTLIFWLHAACAQ